jgi:hypothetical protein
MPKHKLLGRAGSPEKAEMRSDLEFRMPHPKTPWMNQRWDPVSESTPSPAR